MWSRTDASIRATSWKRRGADMERYTFVGKVELVFSVEAESPEEAEELAEELFRKKMNGEDDTGLTAAKWSVSPF
jgi:hypothetical protein